MTVWHSDHSILDLERMSVPSVARYIVGANCMSGLFLAFSFPPEQGFLEPVNLSRLRFSSLENGDDAGAHLRG